MRTILLVDDNSLRAAMRISILDGTASAVIRVQSATDALCLAEEKDFVQNLALVITVPFAASCASVSGPDFVTELRTRLPRIPVLVLGGFSSAEHEYGSIASVYLSQTKSPQELRNLALSLIEPDQRRYA